MKSIGSRRWRRLELVLWSCVALHAIFVKAVHAGVSQPALRLTPSCAAPDSTILVETNLWPRVLKNQVIHRIFIDWTGVNSTPIYAAQSAYSLQWSQTIQVPTALAPGTHSLRVEQLEFKPPPFPYWQTTGCATIHFEVKTNVGDPWAGVQDTLYSPADRDSSNNVGKVFVFDPSVACDVTACEAIRLIHVQQDLGDLGGLLIPFLATTMGYLDGPQRDSTRTTGGFMVDAWGYVPGLTIEGTDKEALGEYDPYLNGDDFGYDLPPSRRGTTVGFVAADSTNITRARDAPSSSDGAMQRLGVSAIVRRFETCAFCSKGEQVGQYFGKATWRWRRALAGLAAIDSTTTSRENPSPMFLEALEKWESARGRRVPRVTPPTQGGVPCPF